jgi:hypothetical protein
MKEFKTLTERQILDAAYLTYLDIFLKAKDNFDKMPHNEAAKARYERAKARVDELHEAILELAD